MMKMQRTKIIPFWLRIAILDGVQFAQSVLLIVHRVCLFDHIDQMILDYLN